MPYSRSLLVIHFVFHFLSFLFYIGVWLINHIVIASGTQQSDSAIQIHVSFLPQTLLPSRLPHNIEQISLGYTVGPFWLSILNTAVCTCHLQPPLTHAALLSSPIPL